jgi:parvulin-like peptidyl-prolyl isomerase
VAVVNAEPITNQDVSNRSRRLLAQGAAQQASPELARQVMESLIVERAQVQMAASVGIFAIRRYAAIRRWLSLEISSTFLTSSRSLLHSC